MGGGDASAAATAVLFEHKADLAAANFGVVPLAVVDVLLQVTMLA